MKETFVKTRFKTASLSMIETINQVLEEYAAQGYDLSLRQLYYQLVARAVIENSLDSYKNTGNLVSKARLAGLIDWNMITDRGRVVQHLSHWDTPADIIDSAATSFRIDKWARQPNFVICFVEKQALEGVLIPACQALDIPFIANKGYSSSSSLYYIGKWMASEVRRKGKRIVALYLGDHDPSGIDMTDDVRGRLAMFSALPDSRLTVERLALNFDQVEDLNPPPNPAKETDSRFRAYMEEFGPTCWELDAVEPRQLVQLLDDAVWRHRDQTRWDEDVAREKRMKEELEDMATEYRLNQNTDKDE